MAMLYIKYLFTAQNINLLFRNIVLNSRKRIE